MTAGPDTSDEWASFWRWANSRGYGDRADIEAAIERSAANLPPSEVRRLVEVSEYVRFGRRPARPSVPPALPTGGAVARPSAPTGSTATLAPRAEITLTWRRVVALLVAVALVAVVATVLTLGGLVAGLGYYADQQEAARPTEPARRPYVAPVYQPPRNDPAPVVPPPRNDPAPVMPLYAPPVSPIDWQAERERAKQEERVRQLEERQRQFEEDACRAGGKRYVTGWGCYP